MAASNAGGKKPDPSEIAIDVEKAAEQLRRVMLSPRFASSLSATHPGEIPYRFDRRPSVLDIAPALCPAVSLLSTCSAFSTGY